jgi:deoxycytidine triphosphate deaminase
MPLTDKQIIAWVSETNDIMPFEMDNVNPASYDLCVGRSWLDYEVQDQERTLFKGDTVTIYPRTLAVEIHNFFCSIIPYGWMWRKPTAILLTTLETIHIPEDMAAEIKLKTTPTRKGLGHPLADWVDPGYFGKPTLFLHALKTVKLEFGQRICQLVLYKLEERVEKSYAKTGHYHAKFEPMRAWDESQS